MIAGATVIAENHNEYFYTLKCLSNIFYQKTKLCILNCLQCQRKKLQFFHFIDRISNCVPQMKSLKFYQKRNFCWSLFLIDSNCVVPVCKYLRRKSHFRLGQKTMEYYSMNTLTRCYHFYILWHISLWRSMSQK